MNNHASEWHRKRMIAELRFRIYGRTALLIATALLVILLGSILWRGLPGFTQTQVKLDIVFDPTTLGLAEGQGSSDISFSAYAKLVQTALRGRFPEVTEPSQLRSLYQLVSPGASVVLRRILENEPELLSKSREVWLPASAALDWEMKHASPDEKRLDDAQHGWLNALSAQQAIRSTFNTTFFTAADSRQPEMAGFLGAMMGSALTLVICLVGVFPIGVATAVYLEEFARKNVLVDIIEVNINNLAAVPSIVFGLLGLAVYINFMGMPRSASLVGGLTLALMILPVIIIATRAALKSVPDSIRDAARALGATPVQVVWHHTLPLAMPGVMTGTILGMARAIGETAPLLMIGMVAFVADVPTNFTAPATAMPVQIYLWASSPEAGFAEKTAAGILLLLVLMLAMNALAIFLRRRFEVRW